MSFQELKSGLWSSVLTILMIVSRWVGGLVVGGFNKSQEKLDQQVLRWEHFHLQVFYKMSCF